MSILIKNGRIITATDDYVADIFIEGETIVAIGNNLHVTADETIDATRCKGNEDCHAGEKCLTHQLWTDLSKSLYEFLDGLTLASFINRPEVRAVARRQDTMASRIATMFPPRMAVSL